MGGLVGCRQDRGTVSGRLLGLVERMPGRSRIIRECFCTDTSSTDSKIPWAREKKGWRLQTPRYADGCCYDMLSYLGPVTLVAIATADKLLVSARIKSSDLLFYNLIPSSFAREARTQFSNFGELGLTSQVPGFYKDDNPLSEVSSHHDFTLIS